MFKTTTTILLTSMPTAFGIQMRTEAEGAEPSSPESMEEAKSIGVVHYDAAEEGARLLAAMDEDKQHTIYPIYEHPTNGAKVYTGTASGAKSKQTLDANGITHICNVEYKHDRNADMAGESAQIFNKRFGACPFEHVVDEESFNQMMVNPNHPLKPLYHYKRVPISSSRKWGEYTPEELDEFYQFVDTAVSAGENVIMHCTSGVHRAGTAATLFLMRKNKQSYVDALTFLRTQNKGITPFSYPALHDLLNHEQFQQFPDQRQLTMEEMRQQTEPVDPLCGACREKEWAENTSNPFKIGDTTLHLCKGCQADFPDLKSSDDDDATLVCAGCEKESSDVKPVEMLDCNLCAGCRANFGV